MRATDYIREHFVDYEFIHEFECFHYDYYDVPLAGMLNIYGHYFLFNIEQFPEWRINGKQDEDGDEDYDYFTGQYLLKPISKFNAWARIISSSWFRFCVYQNGHAALRAKQAPRLLKWADKIARQKPEWVCDFTYNKLYKCGLYASRDNFQYSII